ncbi:hypothetical protein TNCV_5007841 [Trichonephila clavipes]|nr:hypothetical protein TNCV_5007841 [Trichonephila clavipes]
MELKGKEMNILQPLALTVSAATAHKTFGLTDLKSTFSVCTRWVFGGTDIEPRTFGRVVECSSEDYFRREETILGR